MLAAHGEGPTNPQSTPTRGRYIFDTKTDVDLHVLTRGKFRQDSDRGPFKYKLHALGETHSHAGSDAFQFTLGWERQANARKKPSVLTANVTTGSIRKRRGTGVEAGGEGRRYICNRVVKYYRENTFTCTYAPKASLIRILRG